MGGEYNNWRPPDTDGAVGPNHLVVAINGSWRVLTRTGSVLVSQSLGDFWSGFWDPSNPDCSEEPFDPRVLYDAHNDVWITVAIRGRRDCPERSAMLVAVSNTGDPTGNWTKLEMDGDLEDDDWVDFPTLGYSSNYITVAGNMFEPHCDSCAFRRSQLWALERPVTTTSTRWVWRSLDPQEHKFTMMPATTLDSGVTTQYLATTSYATSALDLYTVTGTLGSPPTLSAAYGFPQSSTPWWPVGLTTDFAPQAGTSTLINNGNDRMQGLVLKNGHLWATHNAFLPAGSPNRTSIKWWEVQTDGTVVQDGYIDDPTGTIFRAYPSISVNSNSDVLIGYSQFSATTYASAAYSMRLGTDAPNTFRDTVVFKAGEGSYVNFVGSRNRWGDYSSTHVDPTDDDSFWTIQEFARPPVSGVGRWAVQWAHVEPPADAAPAHDDFNDAELINSLPFTDNTSTDGATTEAGEDTDPAMCSLVNNGTIGSTVWYEFDPDHDVEVTVETLGSDFDTVVAAWSGTSLGSLSPVGCNDDSGGTTQSSLTFDASSGQTYYLQIGGYNGDAGALSLDVFGAGAGSGFCDFDGDMYGDAAVGVPLEDLNSNTVVDTGAVLALPGSNSGPAPGDSKAFDQNSPGIPGGNETGDQFGVALSCGDYNGDGYSDLAVGANAEAIGTRDDSGAATVIFGGPTGLDGAGAVHLYQNAPGVTGSSEAGDFFGESLASGDFNGDGYTDLAVGIPGEAIGTIDDAGAIQVFFGSSTGIGDDQFLSQASAGVAGGAEAGDVFGSSLAAGDFNHDGYTDLGVGIPGEDISGKSNVGAAQIFYGSATGLSVSNDVIFHQDSPGVDGGAESQDFFGHSLAAGDITGDGYAELIVGIPNEAIGSTQNAGAFQWLEGSASGLTATPGNFRSQNSPGVPGGSETDDFFAWSVAVGDVDSDGFAEVIVGSPGENNSSGAVTVIDGGASGPQPSGQFWSQNSAGVEGSSEPGDFFGIALTLSDMNGDGKLDVLIGVSGEAIGTILEAGAVNYLAGSESGLTSSGDRFISQNTPGIPGGAETADLFGYSVAGLGRGDQSAAPAPANGLWP